MRAITEQQKQEAIAAFAYEGTLIADTVYGSGHINDTFRLTFAVGNMGDLDVILQRMNADAFPHPEQLMENIAGVTGFLKKKIIARGGDPERETLNIIPTVDNKPYYRDTNGDYWRSYRFITGASSFDQVETPQQFYESAVAFGSFQRLLADYPAETLHETIPGFHDTRARFAAFEKAVREDVVGRAAEVQKEIAFFLERKETACYFAGRLDRGELPIRVTHNDTKLNNVMLDDKTGKGVCVIDLDTVMPWFLEEAEYPKEAAKIKEILNIMRKGDEFYLEEAKALLGCLLLEITRLNYTNKETRADAEQGRITCIVSRAMDYISDHYMEPIRVEQLAKYSHLSETHFRRVFTEYMHMGPLEYINTVRIRTACEHLKKTEEPVADIAHKCGFTTNSTFNRNFKQMMGVTPVEWRKRPENYEQRLLNYEIHTEKGW